jgi:hypothetical protein
MIGPPITIPALVRLRATVATWARRPYSQAIAIYLAVRIIGVAVLAVMAAQHNLPLLDRLTAGTGSGTSTSRITHTAVSLARSTSTAISLPNAPWAFFPL